MPTVGTQTCAKDTQTKKTASKAAQKKKSKDALLKKLQTSMKQLGICEVQEKQLSVPYGKHKGKLIGDVIAEGDEQWLRWVVAQENDINRKYAFNRGLKAYFERRDREKTNVKLYEVKLQALFPKAYAEAKAKMAAGSSATQKKSPKRISLRPIKK